MAIPSIYKHGIEITKPWSKEMYTYNERIKEYMIREIMFCIDSLNNRPTADKLAKIINPYGYGEGYYFKEIKVDMAKNVENAESYWLAEIWDDLITADFVMPNFTGNGNEVEHLIGFESREEILELRKQFA